jgi:hypothetical protein
VQQATQQQQVKQQPLYPDACEDMEVCHDAFLHAYEASRPVMLRIHGLQEFAAAIFELSRRIPSTSYTCPLDHIFSEFDEDNDGKLSVDDVTAALQSRAVDITRDQVMMFIDGVDGHQHHMVEKHQFADLIFSMASLNLHHAASHDVHPSDELIAMDSRSSPSMGTKL